MKWDKVCLPIESGGLGVLDLRVQNKTLLMKKIYMFFNKQEVPWVQLIWHAYYNDLTPPSDQDKGSFRWKGCCEIIEEFNSMTICSANSGNTISLWTDKWNDEPMQNKYPQHFSYVKKKDKTIKEVYDMNVDNIYNMFHLPLSTIALQQCNETSLTIGSLNLNSANDT